MTIARHICTPGFVVMGIVSSALLGAAEAPETVKTTLEIPLKRPLLCTVATAMKCSLRVNADGREFASNVEGGDKCQFIDDFSKLDEDNLEATRTFVKDTSTTNGQGSDSPLVGTTASFTQKGGQVTVSLPEDRIFRKETMDDLLKMHPSLGVWLDLPSKAEVGATYEIDLMPIAAILLCDIGVEKADSSFTLTSFDAARGIAIFAGTTALHSKEDEDGMTTACEYSLKGEMHVKPDEGRILKITLNGTVKGDLAEGKVTGTIEGTCTVELKTDIGGVAAAAAKEKPKTRANIVKPKGLGVAVSLPSYYDCGVNQPPDGSYYCVRTIRSGADKGVTQFTFKSLAGDTKAPTVFFDTLERDLKKTYPGLKTEKVSCALGAGRAYIFSTRNEGEDSKLRVEVYPCGSAFLMYRVSANPAEFSIAEKEFIAARKTLRKALEML